MEISATISNENKKNLIVKMRDSFLGFIPLFESSLLERMKNQRSIISFELELTARCNNNCRHCYINLPVNNKQAKNKELSFKEIKRIIDEAASLGALWCLLTGGEPLLRKDFFEIYLYLRKKGLLVSVFTNAVLITNEHINFFRKYPPRDMEVTVYGVTQETYERVTRKPGSFTDFMAGVNLLMENNIKVNFKAMALRSNVHEFPEIARFCRERTASYFRFDPFLHLRFDRDSKRNGEIKNERLSPEEIVKLEKADSARHSALKNECDKYIVPEFEHYKGNHLFSCGTGDGSCSVSYDGYFCLCLSLRHRDCIYDLKKGKLEDAWNNFVSKVCDMRSKNEKFLKKCRKCPIINLCIWCPAHSYLETGELDTPVNYFCEVAHARVSAVQGEYLLTKY